MEPVTKSDLKDLMKELRDSIKEAVAAAFGNWKPALERATTSTASLLLATDDYDTNSAVPAPACYSSDQGTSTPDLAPTPAALPPTLKATTSFFMVPPTTYSMDCSGSAIGAPSPTTHATPSRLLQAAAPAFTHELKVLRPVPWPSFKCRSRLAYLRTDVGSFWFVLLPLGEPGYGRWWMVFVGSKSRLVGVHSEEQWSPLQGMYGMPYMGKPEAT